MGGRCQDVLQVNDIPSRYRRGRIRVHPIPAPHLRRVPPGSQSTHTSLLVSKYKFEYRRFLTRTRSSLHFDRVRALDFEDSSEDVDLVRALLSLSHLVWSTECAAKRRERGNGVQAKLEVWKSGNGRRILIGIRCFLGFVSTLWLRLRREEEGGNTCRIYAFFLRGLGRCWSRRPRKERRRSF